MILPPKLEKGDRVYLLNIARKGSYDAGVVNRVFEDWGLHTVLGDTVVSEGFCQFSADSETRLSDLQKALDDPGIKAIFFLRGGYGTVQLLDRIDFSGFRQHPKWLVGYSDITYLHAHINRNVGIATVHASMFSAWHTASGQDLQSLWNLLGSGEHSTVFPEVETVNFRPVAGELVGGNLSILHTVIGTPSDIETDGKILFLEDVFENLMSIERMLWAMRRSGKFDRLSGLLLGDFLIPLKDNETSNCLVPEIPFPDEKTIQSAFRMMIRHFFRNDDFPIVFGLSVGHATGRNTALGVGMKVNLELVEDTLHLTYK